MTVIAGLRAAVEVLSKKESPRLEPRLETLLEGGSEEGSSRSPWEAVM